MSHRFAQRDANLAAILEWINAWLDYDSKVDRIAGRESRELRAARRIRNQKWEAIPEHLRELIKGLDVTVESKMLVLRRRVELGIFP